MDRKKVPVLMYGQWQEFNGDNFIAEEFLNLKQKFDLKTAVETGSCIGSTTIFLSKAFDRVITIEINIEYLNYAHERFKEENLKNVKTVLGNSGEVLYDVIIENNIDNQSVVFLDSHWLHYCPLIDELRAIELAGIKPVIAIHDFKTDDPRMGFDSYNGQDFDLDWIRPRLDGIYGEGGWTHYYNTFERSTEVRRGILYCHAI